MSSLSRPAFAGALALALLFSTSAISAGARHGARHAAPVMHHTLARPPAPPRVAPTPVVQPVVHQRALAMRHGHPPLGARPALVGPPVRAGAPYLPWGVHPRAYPVGQPLPVAQTQPVAYPQANVGPRIIHAPPQWRGHKAHHRNARYAMGGFAAAAPVYPVAAQYAPAAGYLPVERPLTAVYGEPQVIRAPVACSQPAVHHVGRPVSHGPLPQVIYGLQPPCGPPQPASAPAEYARSPLRAAY